MEYKSLSLEVDDLSHEKGTAVIRHGVYDNIDLVNDVLKRGFFTKSWKEKKSADGAVDISFYLNHDDTLAPGKVIDVFDNESKAFTKVKMGSHTLGSDTLKMMDEGTIRKSSFGFNTIKSHPLPSKKSVRQLLEGDHLETSVLTRLSANPKAGIESVKKHLIAGTILELKQLEPDEQKFLQDMLKMHSDQLIKIAQFSAGLEVTSDLYSCAQYWVSRVSDFISDMKSQIKWNGVRDDKGNVIQVKQAGDDQIAEIKARVITLSKFVRNTKASDGCIIDAEAEIKSLEQILAIDTADTSPDVEKPAVSVDEMKALSDELDIMLYKTF